MSDVTVETMTGETLTEVVGLEVGSECVQFVAASGRRFVMQHIQDCCESVSIEDVVGRVEDLIGFPLLVSREDSGATDPGKPSEYAESWTWTFYNFATVKGSVTVRWLGESNGYYSEGVYFNEVTP